MTELHRWQRRLLPVWLGALIVLAWGTPSGGGDPDVCYAVAENGNRLVSIDKSSGANTTIGNTGAT
jgi:hypothetical protein